MAPRRPVPNPFTLQPPNVAFAQLYTQLYKDRDTACATFNQALADGQLVMVQVQDGKSRVLIRPRVEFDGVRIRTVFDGDTSVTGRFLVGKPAGGNEVETKNIFELRETPRPLLGKPGKGGRKPIHKWGEIRQEIMRRIFVNGRPKYPDNVSELAGEVAKWCNVTYKKMPDDSDLRGEIAAMVAQLKTWFE